MGKANDGLYDKVIEANYLKDNGATVLMGGNIDTASNRVTNAPGASIVGASIQPQAKPVKSAYVGATHVVEAGDFATMTAGKYVVKGGNVTSQLAGVAYTGLASGGNPNQIRGINSLLTRRTVLIDSWNYATGAATFNAGNPSSDSFDKGSYADPTRAVPGNLVILEDGDIPETSAYSAKTG
jgi:hypothetical protein